MASKMMFDHLVKVNNLEQKFQQYGLGEKDRTFITEQITASLKKNSKVGKARPWWMMIMIRTSHSDSFFKVLSFIHFVF